MLTALTTSVKLIATMAARFCVNNKHFRNALQVMSFAIICCTLIIYEVTSAVKEENALYGAESGGSSLTNSLLDEISDNINNSDTASNSNHDYPNRDNQVNSFNKNTASASDNSMAKRAVVEQSAIFHNSQDPKDAASTNANEISNHGDYPVKFRSSAKDRLILDNVFLSVKSTKRFHQTRLKSVLKTWFNLAKDQTWIFTDGDDPELERQTNGHIINTHCPATHYRQALCCKMSMEFDAFLRTSKSWFCHFDDDNYVNVPALLELLGKYNHGEDWYLGKPSLKGPIHIPDPNNRTEEVSFWFATGGAGFCISRALALRMSPLASGGKFIKVCDRIQLPDDVTVGYIVGHLLGRNLTVIPKFHSHFETMKFIDMKNPHSEITFSYVRYDNYENILDVKGFTEEEDPTRFLSLHCLLYPNFSYCINR